MRMLATASRNSNETMAAALDSRCIRRYVLAHAGKSLLWSAADMLGIYALIRYGERTPSAAGWIFMSALLWNAGCDVLVGRWVDRCEVRRRPMQPLMVLAWAVIGMTFVASLTVGSRHGAWILLFAVLFRTAFAVFDVPHNAMMARLSATPALGLCIARLRSVAAGVSMVVVGVVAVPLLEQQMEGWLVAVRWLSALAMLASLLMLPFLFDLPRLERTPRAAQVPLRDAQGDRDSMRFAPLCVTVLLGTLALTALRKALPQLDIFHGHGLSACLLAATMGRLLATAVAGGMISGLGRASALRLSYSLCALFVLVLPAVFGAAELQVGATLLVVGLIGVFQESANITSWTALIEITASAPAYQWRVGTRIGTFSMMGKVAGGIGGLLFGLFLSSGETPSSALVGATMLWHLCLLVAPIAWLAGTLPHWQIRGR